MASGDEMDVRLNLHKPEYKDPAHFLKGLRSIETKYDLHQLPYKQSSLRTPGLRSFLEARQAALFCYGMSQHLGFTVLFALDERADYDVVARVILPDADRYAAVQLKELVPDSVNPKASLQAELDKLRKYGASSDLVVAFHINRAMSLDLTELVFPTGAIGELWFYAAAGPDQKDWYLIGDLLKPNPLTTVFEYPS